MDKRDQDRPSAPTSYGLPARIDGMDMAQLHAVLASAGALMSNFIHETLERLVTSTAFLEVEANFQASLKARGFIPTRDETKAACGADKDKLLTIIAAAYQIAGAHDAPAHILDVLADPESATADQVDAMLPYQPDQRQAQADAEIPASVQDQHQGAGDAGAAPACRCGTAAAPKDHEVRELVNTLRDIAIKYHGAQQLRAQIAEVVLPFVHRAASALSTTNPMCERKTDHIMQRDGYRKSGYVLKLGPADRVCVSDGGAVAWFTPEQWQWLMFNRDHVEFEWPKPISALVTPAAPAGEWLSCAPHADMEAVDTLSAILWLYRRLPRGYERQPHIDAVVERLARQTGVDVAGELAERGAAEGGGHG